MPRDARWLFPGLAGGAALLWLLTLFGLGGWSNFDGAVETSPPLVLDEVEVANSERLDALDAYADVSRRPLFAADRRPRPFVIDVGQGDAVSQTDFILTGVMLTPILEMAILTPRDGGDPVKLHRGDDLADRPGWQLIQIEPRRVLFQTPEGVRQFELSGGDGGIGTRMAAPGGDGAVGMSLDSPGRPRTDAARNLEHQARIEAVRRRMAERRAQLPQEQAAPSSSVQQQGR